MATQQRYKIGAVSKLTGIPSVTLRMWERRHGVVEPDRTPAGGRLYSDAHVRRLRLIKRAVDFGYAISTLADLDETALQARLADATPSTDGSPSGPIGVYVIGNQELRDNAQPELDNAFVILERFEAMADVASNASADWPSADVLLVREATITPETIRQIGQARDALGVDKLLVIYDFGASSHVALVRKMGGLAVKAPAGAAEILLLCRALMGQTPEQTSTTDSITQLLGAPIPARRYSTSLLKQCAQLSSAIKCECPEHLARLVEQLVAFERYSAHCESANREDAAMHMMLHSVTAGVRRTMEDALHELLAYEGVDISPAQ